MKKIGNFYKKIYESMGKKSLVMIAIVLLFFFLTGRRMFLYGDVTGLFIILGLVTVYHIVFYIDMKRKEKMKKK